MQVWNLLHAARWKHRTQKVAKNCYLGTIAQLCRAMSSQLGLRHISTIGKKLFKQQYVLHMSSQYGEIRQTSGWERSGSLKHPCTLVGRSPPYCKLLWGEILLFNKFFPIVHTCLSCEDIARQSCAMVPRWRVFASFLRPVFAASRVHHISDMHSKFALRPHHVWKYGRHPMSDRWD